MGLRFSCVAGWGWVAEIGGRVDWWAHPPRKIRVHFHGYKHILLGQEIPPCVRCVVRLLCRYNRVKVGRDEDSRSTLGHPGRRESVVQPATGGRNDLGGYFAF
jgi:hypothetical protein